MTCEDQPRREDAVRFLLTALGQESWNERALETWHEVVAQDSVGRHGLAPTPESADRIVFVDLQQHPDDPYLARLRRHPLVRSHPDKVMVYDQRDRPVRTLAGVYVSTDRHVSSSARVAGGPYLQNHTSIAPSDVEPDLLWSFAGARTHSVRDRVLSLADERGVLLDTSSVPVFSTAPEHRADAELARDRYRELLGRSRFVLCPRGHGPASFRLFETMAAGRVPVIISDRWTPPPRVDWTACSLLIPEAQVGDVPRRLRAAEARWEELAAAADDTWRRHFAPDRVWDHIAESLSQLPVSPPRRLWWMQRDVVRTAAGRGRRRLVRR